MKEMTRAMLETVAILMLAAIGCADPEATVHPTEETDGKSTGKDGDADGGSDTGPSESYANVTAVAASGGDGAYLFGVTLETSDIDCTRYADWWEVVTPSGDLVYRRILAHPHTATIMGNPFTRSSPGGAVAVASDQVVVVRGHMNDAGYVGKVMRGTVDGGFVEAPDIGTDFYPGLASRGEQPDECIPEEQFGR